MSRNLKPARPGMPGRPMRLRRSAVAKFLEVLAESCQVTVAAQAAGIPRRTLYDRRRADLEFARAWDQALEEGADLLVAEAYRRAVEGVEEPVVSAGVLVTTVRHYSDRLLELLLRAHRPDRFARPAAAIGVEAEGDGPVRVKFRIEAPSGGEGT